MPHTSKQANVSYPELADALGNAGVRLYAFAAWLSPNLHIIGLGLCLFGLVLDPHALRRVTSTRAFAVWVGVALYLSIQSFWGSHLFPGSLGEQFREAWLWLGCGNFIIIGWWLKGDPRIIRNILTLAVVGLCIGILHSVDLAALLAFQTGKQTGFHLTASIGGLLAATVILGLLLNPPATARHSSSRWRNSLQLVTWSATTYLMAFLLVASQSRATWISAMITIPLVLHLRKRKRSTSQDDNSHAIGLGWLVLLLVMAGIGFNRQMLLERITPDLTAVESPPSNNPATSDKRSSLGYRLKAQKFGLEKWKEHPLIGWGTASTRQLIADAELPELWHEPTQEWLNHLHNGYLELLVRFGLVGIGIFLSSVISLLWSFLIKGVWGELQARNLSWLFVGALVMTVIWTGGVFQMTNRAWQAYWTLLLASSFSVSLFSNRGCIEGQSHHRQTEPETQEPSVQESYNA